MTSKDRITLYYSPQTRATGARVLLEELGAPYDLVLANILLGPLKRIAAPMRPLLARKARVVLSGLLPQQANAAIAAYRAQGLTLMARITCENWTTLVMQTACSRRAGAMGSGAWRA